jgi:hypothetical protein
MKLDAPLAVPALGVALLATSIVVVRAAIAPAPPAVARMTPEEQRVVAAAVAADEITWSNLSAQAFPEDHWSTRDDFHARELKRLKEIAKERRIPIEDVLRAVDDDVHRAHANAESPDYRGAHAVPCKPRPIYD